MMHLHTKQINGVFWTQFSSQPFLETLELLRSNCNTKSSEAELRRHVLETYHTLDTLLAVREDQENGTYGLAWSASYAEHGVDFGTYLLLVHELQRIWKANLRVETLPQIPALPKEGVQIHSFYVENCPRFILRLNLPDRVWEKLIPDVRYIGTPESYFYPKSLPKGKGLQLLFNGVSMLEGSQTSDARARAQLTSTKELRSVEQLQAIMTDCCFLSAILG